MKKTNFTKTQIVKAIKEHENGRDALDICRELGVSKAAFYKWRQRYGGLEVFGIAIDFWRNYQADILLFSSKCSFWQGVR